MRLPDRREVRHRAVLHLLQQFVDDIRELQVAGLVVGLVALAHCAPLAGSCCESRLTSERSRCW